ncbi:hypothetical protein [Roseobacter fucihabitans]|uniref:hypothetical protein n=1 Tax=Roseobacter fucihabitans TaxID=1537242 RepID=UPI00331302A9
MTSGCVIERMSKPLLTDPIFLPLVISLGSDPIRLGVFGGVALKTMRVTPHAEWNRFTCKNVARDIATPAVFPRIIPDWVTDLERLALVMVLQVYILCMQNQNRVSGNRTPRKRKNHEPSEDQQLCSRSMGRPGRQCARHRQRGHRSALWTGGQ